MYDISDYDDNNNHGNDDNDNKDYDINSDISVDNDNSDDNTDDDNDDHQTKWICKSLYTHTEVYFRSCFVLANYLQTFLGCLHHLVVILQYVLKFRIWVSASDMLRKI